ncbi:MAG: hypothetical protein KBB10_06060 [Clostridia bacterium]|nr:hypothetical protein [Clostridia bacterium]
MKLFHRHLYLFDIFKNISHYNVADFNQDKVTRNQDIVMLVLEDQNEKIITKFVIADTDINAVYSFHQDDRLSRFKLKYILREKEINEYLSGKEMYSIPDEYKEDVKKIYNEILSRMKEIVDNYKEYNIRNSTAIGLCERFLKEIGKEYYFYVTNPIEKFNVKKSYDYINEVILNRLEDKQKEQIKKYYDNLQEIYDYHLNTIGEKIDEAGELIKNFRGY